VGLHSFQTKSRNSIKNIHCLWRKVQVQTHTGYKVWHWTGTLNVSAVGWGHSSAWLSSPCFFQSIRVQLQELVVSEKQHCCLRRIAVSCFRRIQKTERLVTNKSGLGFVWNHKWIRNYLWIFSAHILQKTTLFSCTSTLNVYVFT